MRHVRSVIVLVLAALLISPVAALAQGEPQMEEFVSEDGLLTLAYPEDWAIEENSAEVGLPGVTIANSQEALDNLLGGTGDGPQAGEVGLIILLLPTDLLGVIGLAVEPDAAPADLAEVLAQSFVSSEPAPTDATAEASGPSLGETETVELNEDGLEAGYVPITDVDVDGALIAFNATEGVIVLIFVAAPTGEYTDEVRDLTIQIAASIEYTGSGAALMDALMGGGIGETDGAPTEEPTAEATEAAG